MRLKWQVIVLFNIIFILYVSFKILQPEIDIQDEDDEGTTTMSPVSEKKYLLKVLEEKYTLRTEYCKSGENPWEIAARWVKDREIIPEYAPELGCVLHSLKNSRILSADVGYKGSQLKLSLELEGGQRVAFKPKWYERDHKVSTVISGWDRHNGEIAAFHLSRLLELRRTPVAVGRKINLKTEIIPVATDRLLKTFYNKDGNLCFYGKCLYCKGEDNGVCADGDVLEGVMILWLPNKYQFKRYNNPWRRSYKKGVTRRWEQDMSYCEDVIMMDLYRSGPQLLDLIDATLLDYLIGNGDRHHYETLGTKPNSMIMIMDNGKSFGNPDNDEYSILAPLYQCCRLRETTWHTLLILQNGVLSTSLKRILDQDSIAPVLDEKYYTALDRRLEHILLEVKMCMERKGIQNVLVTNA